MAWSPEHLDGVCSKEERKAQLRAAAQDMKQTGKAEAAFEESSYGVGDDKSPNIHTRVSLYLWSHPYAGLDHKVLLMVD